MMNLPNQEEQEREIRALHLRVQSFLRRGDVTLEEGMTTIQQSEQDGNAECAWFLENMVPWDNMMVPDPLGHANKG